MEQNSTNSTKLQSNIVELRDTGFYGYLRWKIIAKPSPDGQFALYHLTCTSSCLIVYAKSFLHDFRTLLSISQKFLKVLISYVPFPLQVFVYYHCYNSLILSILH